MKKTIKQGSVDFYNEILNNKQYFDMDNYNFDDVINAGIFAFVAGAAFAQKWYRVEDVFPELDDVVLFTSDRTYIGTYTNGKWFDINTGKVFFSDEVDLWRPIELE